MKVFKAFVKALEAPQRSEKIKTLVIFFSLPGIGTGRVEFVENIICVLTEVTRSTFLGVDRLPFLVA